MSVLCRRRCDYTLLRGGLISCQSSAGICRAPPGTIRELSLRTPLEGGIGAGTSKHESARVVAWPSGLLYANPRPQRGTSPSPRVVFDRATFSSPRPLVSGSQSLGVMSSYFGESNFAKQTCVTINPRKCQARRIPAKGIHEERVSDIGLHWA